MKQTNVIFNKNGGVHIVIGQYTAQQDETVMVNPIIPIGVPPHYWKTKKNKIICMSNLERLIIDKKLNIIDNLSKRQFGLVSDKQLYMHYVKTFTIGMAGAFFLHLLIKLL